MNKPLERRVRHSLLYLALIAGTLLLSAGLYRGGLHLVELKAEDVTVNELPAALALSFLRMTLSYVASLAFAFALGVAAARSAWGERLIIPTLDILQSVPVVGFFPAAISFFIGISNGSRVGVELAAVFLIFTSQCWNIAFAVYEAVKSIPQDRVDAVTSFGVTGSRRFWKLYAPASIPRVVYNSILSWSNGWFFLVACEIIAVGTMRYHLPGIGSFLARAAETDQIRLVLMGLAALTTLILFLDLLIWRPASVWAERFRQDSGSGSTGGTEAITAGPLFHFLASAADRAGAPVRRMLAALLYPVIWLLREVLSPLLWDLPAAVLHAAYVELHRSFFRRIGVVAVRYPRVPGVLLGTACAVFLIWACNTLWHWLMPLPAVASQIPMAILASTGRLVLSLLLSLLWVLPLCLWVWDKPKLRQWLNTIAQVGASLPAVALFPLIILFVIRKFGGGMEEASILLLMTGMQWYLLFNGLGGTAIIPPSLVESTRSLGLDRKLTWKRLVIPAMQPALITGAITAWGGGWNALVVSEYVTHKDEVLTVRGIGALLNRSVYQSGDSREIVLCILAMVGWIVLLNSVFWRPIYRTAIDRYRMDS